jgi:hypothetical protein
MACSFDYPILLVDLSPLLILGQTAQARRVDADKFSITIARAFARISILSQQLYLVYTYGGPIHQLRQ